MKKFLLIFLLLLPVKVEAQLIRMFQYSGVPAGGCQYSYFAQNISNGDLYYCDMGAWASISTGASIITGVGTSGQVAFFSAAGVITSDAGFTYESAGDDLTVIGQITASGGFQTGTGAATSVIPYSGITTSNGTVRTQQFNDNAGTAALAIIRAGNASGDTESGADIRVFGTGVSTIAGTFTQQDGGQFTCGTSLSGGCAFGTRTTTPAYLGTNNTIRMTISGDGTTFLPVDNVTALGGPNNRWLSSSITGLTVNTIVLTSGITGNVAFKAGTPVVAGNGTIQVGSQNFSGRVDSTITGAMTTTVTFSSAYTVKPVCDARNETTVANLVGVAVTTTVLTLTGTTVTGDDIAYTCTAY